jgi:DNA-directed RNA polymerase subunit F
VVRENVNHFLSQAREYLSVHGDPVTTHEYEKTASEGHRGIREEIAIERAMHRFYARKIAEIEINRTNALIRELRADPSFRERYRNTGHSEHREAVDKLRGLQRAIEKHTVAIAQLECASYGV